MFKCDSQTKYPHSIHLVSLMQSYLWPLGGDGLYQGKVANNPKRNDKASLKCSAGHRPCPDDEHTQPRREMSSGQSIGNGERGPGIHGEEMP